MRKVAHAYLEAWQLPHLAEPVTLALTELLTNVHRHVPDRWCTSTLIRTLTGIRIEIYDRGPAFLPEPPHNTDELSESGRGLAIVERITDDWNVVTHRVGKTVWCELRA